jgi:LAGLIDADG endonuclease
LIGFVEGDGCFEINKGSLTFAIGQKDRTLLDWIQKKLDFGYIKFDYNSKQKQHDYVYNVYKLEHIEQLLDLFNGNFILKKTRKSFKN